jgi:hypothetical protein
MYATGRLQVDTTEFWVGNLVHPVVGKVFLLLGPDD